MSKNFNFFKHIKPPLAVLSLTENIFSNKNLHYTKSNGKAQRASKQSILHRDRQGRRASFEQAGRPHAVGCRQCHTGGEPGTFQDWRYARQVARMERCVWEFYHSLLRFWYVGTSLADSFLRRPGLAIRSPFGWHAWRSIISLTTYPQHIHK